MSLEIGQVLVRVDQPVRGRGRGQTHLSAKNVPNVAQHGDLNIISIFLKFSFNDVDRDDSHFFQS